MTSRLTIDLDAVATNYGALKAAAGGAEVAPAVKADGYGLGAKAVSQTLWSLGARAFYVARLAEGEALRAVLPQATIYVLDGATPGSSERLAAMHLTPVLSSVEQVERWARHGAGAAALHIDTGLNRLGVRHEQMAQVTGVEIELVISHLACAEIPDHPLNAVQLHRFKAASAAFPHARRSLAGSAGVYLGPEFHFDQARPGISLYGGGPRGVAHPDIRPVAALTAPILQVREVSAGESVGYGATFTAPETMRVGVAAVGYADGVLRANGGRGQVWFGGALRPLLGRVSMDMVAFDLGDTPAAEGDPVEVIGPHIGVDTAADFAGTNAYEVLTRLGTRAEHRYVGAAAAG